MKCPFCGSIDSKVIDSRLNEDGTSIRRRRECISCLKRYTTYGKIEYTPILVVKSNGNRQIFDPAKIKNGILKACEAPGAHRQGRQASGRYEKQVNNSLAPGDKFQRLVKW